MVWHRYRHTIPFWGIAYAVSVLLEKLKNLRANILICHCQPEDDNVPWLVLWNLRQKLRLYFRRKTDSSWIHDVRAAVAVIVAYGIAIAGYGGRGLLASRRYEKGSARDDKDDNRCPESTLSPLSRDAIKQNGGDQRENGPCGC